MRQLLLEYQFNIMIFENTILLVIIVLETLREILFLLEYFANNSLESLSVLRITDSKYNFCELQPPIFNCS